MTLSIIDWKTLIRSSFIAMEYEKVPGRLNSSFAPAQRKRCMVKKEGLEKRDKEQEKGKKKEEGTQSDP